MTDYKQSNKFNQEEPSLFHMEEDEDNFSYDDYKMEDWIAFSIFWLLAFTVFSQFISRYVFAAPLGWTEELARYQLVCIGFIGACMGIRKNNHIFVALFHRYLPKKLSILLYKLIALFNVLFIATLAYFAWLMIPLLQIHKMASLNVPISVLYGFVFASLVIMALRSCQFLFNALTKPDFLLNQETTASYD